MYILQYLKDLIDSDILLSFKDLYKLPDDDWYQMKHAAL